MSHFTLQELAKVQEKLLHFDALMKEHLQKHSKTELNHSKYHMQVSSCMHWPAQTTTGMRCSIC